MNIKISNERSLIPLLLTSIAVAIPLIFILGLVVGNQLHGNSSLTADSISSWLSAIATVAIAILTFILAKETWYLREAQIRQLEELKRENIRPNICFQLESSPAGFSLINVKISNLGKGIAKKILIKFLDRNGNELQEATDVVVKHFRELAIFRQGIQTMGIGQEITSFVFSFHDLKDELKSGIFTPYFIVDISFEDIAENAYKNSFTIDFSEFQGKSQIGGNSLYQISDELKLIREVLQRATSHNQGRLSVDMFSSQDRKDEAKALREWLDDQRSGN
jgi:uncharacterized membrane protein YidH (DUF202 family)